jgi:hypothetical protein
MKSHEFATQLKVTAEHILNRPDVEIESNSPFVFMSFWDKKLFVEVARTMGPGKKEFSSTNDLHYTPNGTCLTLSIPRDKVCRKIQDVKWECEPLLSAEEVDQLGKEQEEMPF